MERASSPVGAGRDARSTRVQIEGPHIFRQVVLDATVDQAPLAIRFTPRSRWVCAGIVAYPVVDEAQVKADLLTPLAREIWFMPAAEAKEWQREPLPPANPMPDLPQSVRDKGYVAFTRHYLECVYPNSCPRPDELGTDLKLFAAQGQYEATAVAVRPLRDIKGTRVAVTGLQGPAGAKIPATSIDVRHVKYMLARPNYTVEGRYREVPDVLERFDALDLAADRTERFWLTVKAPDQRPGMYRGTVTLSFADAPETKLALILRVLPIKLQDDPTKLNGIYYYSPLDRYRNAKDPVSKAYFLRKTELEYADMRAHGLRLHVMSLWSPAPKDGKFQFDFDFMQQRIDLYRKYGFVGPIPLEFSTSEIYRQYVPEGFAFHNRGMKLPPEEPFMRDMTACVRTIEEERKRRGWPEFLYYPIDEPSQDPNAIAFMIMCLKAVHAVPGCRTYVTADPTVEGYAPLRPYIDVWCTQPFLPDRDTILKDTAARKVEYWCYPNHVNGENDHTTVTGARMTYGFGFWRSGFRTLIPWIYAANNGDPMNYLDGSSMDFFNRSEPDGTPMPVAMWEAYREGWDDYRYVYTLEQLIAKAKGSPKRAVTAAASAAENELRGIWDAINVQAKYKYDGMWEPQEFDVYRWMIARQIMRLQDAMK